MSKVLKILQYPTDESVHEFYAGKQILITGGNGFVGTALTRQLETIDCRIWRASRTLVSETYKAGSATIHDVQGDLLQENFWSRFLQSVDVIFHLAAQTSLKFAEQDITADFRINVLPLLNLLKACQEYRRQPIVLFSGTATQVGLCEHWPVNEGIEDCPVTVYDTHKLVAETYLKFGTHSGLFHGVSLRLANIYGPGPGNHSEDRGVLNKMIHRALRGEDLVVFGKGETLRDYLYVADAARAFLMAGAYAHKLRGKHYLLGSGVGHSISEAFHLVAEQVSRRTKQPVLVKHHEPYVPSSPIETRNFVADTTAFSEKTGWLPKTNLPQGIDLTADACLVHA